MGSLPASFGRAQWSLRGLLETPCTVRIPRGVFPVHHTENRPTAHRDNSRVPQTWLYSAPAWTPRERRRCCDPPAVSRLSSALFEQTAWRGGVEPELSR